MIIEGKTCLIFVILRLGRWERREEGEERGRRKMVVKG